MFFQQSLPIVVALASLAIAAPAGGAPSTNPTVQGYTPCNNAYANNQYPSPYPLQPDPGAGNSGSGNSDTTISARKAAIKQAGGNNLMIAVAMQETAKMTADYPYGDLMPDGVTHKTKDSANFGIFKQNWFILRQCCSLFLNQPEANWNNGAQLNTDLNADVRCANECQQAYGQDGWLAANRAGGDGLCKPDNKDVPAYMKGVHFLLGKLENTPNALTDNTKFWVNTQNI